MKTEQKPLVTARDFREFFAAIPDEKWANESVMWEKDGKCCAYGLLGVRSATPEDPRYIDNIPNAVNLNKINVPQKDYNWREWTDVSDGRNPFYNQTTAKARVLAALDEIIAKEAA